jgi:pSer/pThr/pTyr-binding forkhead associated (FHA) protein
VPDVFCPECGFRNSVGAGFCARCGVSLVPEQPDDQTTISFQPAEDDDVQSPLAGLARDQAALVIRGGGGRAGETYAIQAERTTIGRHPAADIFLDDVTVSRNHALVERDGDHWVIVDQDSLNGTYINRRRGDRVPLADGDEIQIGKYKLTFIIPS